MERKSVLKQIFEQAKGDLTLIIALAIIFTFIIFSLFPQYIAKEHFTHVDLSKRLNPPNLENPFGCDFLGRDILSLIIMGSRTALLVCTVPTFIGASIGVGIGIASGYVGGRMDDLIQRIVEIVVSFPGLLLSLSILQILGPGLWNAMWAVMIGRITGYIRITRSLTFSAKETGYVEYAKALGAGRTHVMIRHILPNIITPIIVQLTFSMPGTLLSVASLSFLGLGANPPSPDWGVLMQESRQYLRYAPWAAITPGVAIFLVAFSFNSVGEALRDIVDPRRKYIQL